jgi:hypothetical protein
MFVYYIFQQQIPNWKSLFKNSILSGSSLGAHWELSRSSSQLRVYNTRKRYAVIEQLDLTRNISWLASCFSKIKKPNKHCSGNQYVIAGVCILTQFPIFILT